MTNIVHNINNEEISQYPDKYFDIAIIDPPYGIDAANMTMGSTKNNESTAKKLKTKFNKGSGKLKNRALNTMDCEWDKFPPKQQFFDEVFRVSKNQIIFGMNYFNLPPTRCVIVWDKIQPWENFSQVELAWTSFNKPAKLYRISSRGGANNEAKIHPTQKPIKLYEKIYNDFVTEGMKILDTNVGSGSHRIVAQRANCYFIGYEIHSEYWESQEKRYNEFLEKNQPKLF